MVHILDKIGYMENFGTGIRRIFTLYEGFSKQPQIITTNNSYKITLFNQNYLLYQDNIDEGLLRIVEFLKGNQEASRQEIQNSVKYSKDKTLRLLKELIQENIVIKSGSSVATTYKLK